ncbi:hypothetical protein N8J89_25935 [Crossiella sp. CA-258035]|uniref:hypothetical protein n=1 Tax=Crossiella sp. CA-258035 TaxID=2981138 RepID=UPI0024BC3721|nr:hypothetical protein [Crossiella sp. CA-258035]WHT16567.1 hypothetical protein N8J89_25935 [Crossiella sp. CA-258035]
MALFGSREQVLERYTHRYLPGQQLYREAARPVETADVLLGYEDPAAPVLRRWPVP